jgi:hypothetical protein
MRDELVERPHRHFVPALEEPHLGVVRLVLVRNAWLNKKTLNVISLPMLLLLSLCSLNSASDRGSSMMCPLNTDPGLA